MCLNAGAMGRQDAESETLIPTFGGVFDGTKPREVIAFAQNQRDEIRTMPYVGALAAEPGAKQQTYVLERYSGETLSVHGTQDPDLLIDQAHTLGRNHGQENAVLSVALRGRDGGATAELGDDVAGCLRASVGGGDKPHVLAPAFAIQAGATRINPLSGPGGIGVQEGIAYTLEARAEVQAVAFRDQTVEVAGTMKSCKDSGGWSNSVDHAAAGYMQVLPDMRVRRLTPRECERLQGFPDDYTLIPVRGKPAADGPRYKALGNSMAVPVMRWIGKRIAAVDQHLEKSA